MQVIILVLSIIILLLVIYTFLNTHKLKEICNDIKGKVYFFEDKLDLNNLVLETKLKNSEKYANDVDNIIFGNDESTVKIGKLIELSRKRTTPN